MQTTKVFRCISSGISNSTVKKVIWWRFRHQVGKGWPIRSCPNLVDPSQCIKKYREQDKVHIAQLIYAKSQRYYLFSKAPFYRPFVQNNQVQGPETHFGHYCK